MSGQATIHAYINVTLKWGLLNNFSYLCKMKPSKTLTFFLQFIFYRNYVSVSLDTVSLRKYEFGIHLFELNVKCQIEYTELTDRAK